jgi:hypothetical protein
MQPPLEFGDPKGGGGIAGDAPPADQREAVFLGAPAAEQGLPACLCC